MQPPAVSAPKDSIVAWLREFQLCRALMRDLTRKIAITDMYRFINVGYWFTRENQRYVAGGLSESQRLLFRSLVLLDESDGQAMRDWYWTYSHCLEFQLLKSSLLTTLTKDLEDRALHHPDPKWLSRQMSLLQKGVLTAKKQSAMRELLAIGSEKQSSQS